MKKALTILGSIGMFCLLLIAMGIGKIVGHSAVKSAYEPNMEVMLADASRKVNATLPVMVDQDTRLDTTMPGPKSFLYMYTLINYPSNSVDENFLTNWKPQLTQKVCGSSDMHKILSIGVTAVYVYRGNDGVEVGRIGVTQQDCALNASSSPPPTNSVSIGSQPQQAPATISSQTIQKPMGYNDKADQKCWNQYQDTIASIPADTPLGEYSQLNDRAIQRRDKCISR